MDDEKVLLTKDEDEHYVYPIDTINPEPDNIQGCPDAEVIDVSKPSVIGK
jgi:hypothetical protein